MQRHNEAGLQRLSRLQGHASARVRPVTSKATPNAVDTAIELLTEELKEHDSDRLRDVLDQLTGWCAPHMKLVSRVEASSIDREVLEAIGDCYTTARGLAEGLGIAITTAQQRLVRLEEKGLMRRWHQTGRRETLWMPVREGATARAILTAYTKADVPASDIARDERLLVEALGDDMTTRDRKRASQAFRFQSAPHAHPPRWVEGESAERLAAILRRRGKLPAEGTPLMQPSPPGVHVCVGCGIEHFNCCGLCPKSPEWMRTGGAP